MSVIDVDALNDRLSERMEKVETRLRQEVCLNDLQVDPATSYLAEAGGKRLRPALVLLTSELGPQPDAPAVEASAVLVELTHLASLYHDDVMDEAPMRRGVPSAQATFGNSVAILAGDVLFARASIVVSKLGGRAIELHARTFERLCQGQLHETIGCPQGVTAKDHYIQVLADKTGSLIAASAMYGVQSSGGSEELARAVAEYGERVGVAFQLADDVLDILFDGETTGKTPGTDLREGVDTMPILLLREKQDAGVLDSEGAAILELLASGNLSDDAVLADVVRRLRSHTVVEETQQMAVAWAEEAKGFLAKVPEGAVKEALIQFADAAVNRAS